MDWVSQINIPSQFWEYALCARTVQWLSWDDSEQTGKVEHVQTAHGSWSSLGWHWELVYSVWQGYG